MYKQRKDEIAIQVVGYIGRMSPIKDVTLPLLVRKSGMVEKVTGISQEEYLEFAMELLERITGFELQTPGQKREERKFLGTERLGEISWLVIKLTLLEEGISFRDLDRKIGNIAAATGIGRSEMEEFAREIIQETTAEGVARIGQGKRRQKQKSRK